MLFLLSLGMPVKESYNYSLYLHLGTVLASILLLRRWIPLRSIQRFVALGVASSMAVGVPLYLLFQELMPQSPLVTVCLVGFLLIVTGLILRFGWRERLDRRVLEDISLRDGLIVGAFQGLSVLPGLSRSGITVATLTLRGYRLRESFLLSFLLSIPTILLAEIGLSLLGGLPPMDGEAIIGLVTSFLTGILTLKLLLDHISKKPYWLVCIILGILSLLPLPFL
jgi:undecaprenyl-diphosphatase